MRNTVLFILLLLLFAGLLSYNWWYEPFLNLNSDSDQVVQQTPSPTPTTSLDEIAIEALTPQQKIAQLLAVPLQVNEALVESLADDGVTESSEAAEVATEENVAFSLAAQQPGFIVWFGSNIDVATAQQVTAWQAQNMLLQIPGSRPVTIGTATFVDHEGGQVIRLSGDGFTAVPSWQDWCQLPLDEQMTLIATTVADLQRVGIDGVFGPVIDVGSSSVMGNRICSQKPETVMTTAELLAEAYLQAGIMPVFKHFPGIGDVSVDLHDRFENVAISTASARTFSTLLAPERFATDAEQKEGVIKIGVMSTHAGVTELNPGVPCSVDPECAGQISSINADTLVFSDDLAMDGLRDAFEQEVAVEQVPTLEQMALLALQAGNNVLVFGPGVELETLENIVNQLALEYEQDAAFKAVVDRHLEQVLRYKTTYGLLQ